MKIKLTKEQTELFQKMSTTITTSRGESFMGIPNWYRETDEEGVYEVLSYENLPNDAKNILNVNPYLLPGVVYTPRRIIRIVSKVTQTPVELIKSKTRKRDVVMARQIAMYFIVTKANLSETETGKIFSNRNHSTVNWAKKVVNNLVRFDKTFKETFEKVKEELCSPIS